MKKMNEIVENYPLTDKGPKKNDGSIGHDYTSIYEKVFSTIREKNLKILEIGFGGGDSLKLWAEYFPKSEIFCIDNNLSRIKEYNYVEHDRIKIFYGDQSDKNSLKNSIQEMKITYFDIIIDDGSHIESHISTTFDVLFPLLENGGFYFIEDCPSKMNLTNNDIEYINYDKSKYTSSHLITIKKNKLPK